MDRRVTKFVRVWKSALKTYHECWARTVCSEPKENMVGTVCPGTVCPLVSIPSRSKPDVQLSQQLELPDH